MDKIPEPNPDWSGDNPDPSSNYAPYKLYNIGNNNPVELLRFIEVIEDCLGKKGQKRTSFPFSQVMSLQHMLRWMT